MKATVLDTKTGEELITADYKPGYAILKNDYKIVIPEYTKKEKRQRVIHDIKDFWKSFFYEIGVPIILAFIVIHVLFIASYFVLHLFGIV